MWFSRPRLDLKAHFYGFGLRGPDLGLGLESGINNCFASASNARNITKLKTIEL